MQDSPSREVKIRIPAEIKKKMEESKEDFGLLIQEALEKVLQNIELHQESFSLVPSLHAKLKKERSLSPKDIPPGTFAHLPHLSLEEYESIVDESSWEYLDGLLIHHSPESNRHNSILNFLNYRAMSALDPSLYIIRTSRIALSINEEKPEPDFMVFDRDDFRRKKRLDGTESEIIESAPLLIVEIVSESSTKIDKLKEEKYLQKGVREYWQIDPCKEPLKIKVCSLKQGEYRKTVYNEGEVRSRIVPDFYITFKEINDPDSIR